MKKIIFISFFLLSFSGCHLDLHNTRNLNVQYNKIKSHSQSGKYLSANYSIFKGDVFSANNILKFGENNLTLLELQFFSNLISGNFEIANNISKKPERFGHGAPEGIIASEAANNAVPAAAMIPLLALGIPGEALTAMMLSVFYVHSIIPGPNLFINHADFVYGLYMSLFLVTHIKFQLLP